MDEVFLRKLQITNFKCFQNLNFELESGMNIVYGLNASGKTAILEAISIAAGSFFMKLSEVEKRDIEKTDIRLFATSNSRLPEYQVPVEIEATGYVMKQLISWKRTLNTIEGGITSIFAKEMADLSSKAASIVQHGENTDLPVIAYFSTQRLFVPRRESEKKPIGRLSAYYNALNATNIKKHIQLWFKDAEFEQYQMRQTNPDYTNSTLEGLKKLLLQNFTEWQNIYYYEPETDSRLDKGLFFQLKNGDIIPEKLLSDGYRNFLWLILEIAWRCYTINPFLKEDAPKKTKGIILIDEIDLHLHPKWQQKIADVLTENFPNLQFVVTTHSPIVLSSQKANVFLLNEYKLKRCGSFFGMKPSYVLEVFMGLNERLPNHLSEINRYFQLINDGLGKSDEALRIRKKLSDEIPKGDPLFSEADALIEFLAL
ncbi:MAG: AAA family ATPase [Sphingobacteriales bacterium]|nr:MAG: AAA family ATPase [Sphingobacteriales bacterium]